MEVSQIMYAADPALIDTIVGELKSQGTFDQFRKECIADVDTKPAYQNLHQRVESTVTNFLEGSTWKPDLNKNQLRDSLRKHIHEMGFLETGVERIVDQVVNPKVHTVFMPQVEDVVYRVQGIPKPDKKSVTSSTPSLGSTSKSGAFNSGLFNQPPPFMPGMSFLPPALQSHMQKPPTLADLLPTDLDPVSPESSKESLDEVEQKGVCDDTSKAEEGGIIKHHDDSMDSHLSGFSDLTSHGSDRDSAHGSQISKLKSSNTHEDVNEDSHLSKVSSNSSLSCELSSEHKFLQTEDNIRIESNDVPAERVNIEEQDGNNAFDSTHEDSNVRRSLSPDPMIHYGDQFSMEEEVATTVIHDVHEEVPQEGGSKDELVVDANSLDDTDTNVGNNCNVLSEDGQFKTSLSDVELTRLKYEPNEEITENAVDDNSQIQSEDSQFSESSENKLHIDEMKDFNTRSENSNQNEDENSSLKTSSEDFLSKDSNKVKAVVENIVEASEEARHGFDDSQDALERPPLPRTPPAAVNSLDQPPLPPTQPAESSTESEERPPLPVTPSAGSDFELDDQPPLPPTPPSAKLGVSERSPSPSTPPHPPAPAPSADIERLIERPPPPPTPPSAASEHPPLPPSPTAAAVSTPPALHDGNCNEDFNMSPSYDERAIPKTPRWEPRTPEALDERHTEVSSSFPSFEYLDASTSSKEQKNFSTSYPNRIEQDDGCLSDSEDMQVAWSPLSMHGDQADEGCGEKPSNDEIDEMSPKDSAIQEKSKEHREHTEEQHRGSHKDDKHYHSDRHREKERTKDGRSKDRHKEDDRSHKESSSSSRKHDEKHSKHRDKYDRRDSRSRSRHEDKNRSDKERERQSSTSHHRSNEKKRDDKKDEKERSSSSRHKSSRSDDCHRHRERDRKNSNSGGTGNRREDKSHDRTYKADEKQKPTSKSHSSDRDRRDSDRKGRDPNDKDKKSEKDKDRSRKDVSRHEEKRREKEREKDRKEKSANVCRPNPERRSPDPDSNDGSMFGGNGQTSTGPENKVCQLQDNGKNENNKSSGSTDSNSKNTDSCQHSTICAEHPSQSSCQSICSSSSLPFKKRRLLPESDIKHGQLVLRIKKSRKSKDVSDSSRNRRIAIRRLERKSVRNLDNCPRFSLKGATEPISSAHYNESSFKYFEDDWPTKVDDEDFLAYVHGLDNSQTLSGMSDFSDSESEEEETLSIDDSNNTLGPEETSVSLYLALLTEEQAQKVLDPVLGVNNFKEKERKRKAFSTIPKTKSRTRQRKMLKEEDIEIKCQKVNSQEVVQITPAEQKSRRARKPNKRYSNEEFTSHFDYEEVESPEDDRSEVLSVNKSELLKENLNLGFENPVSSPPDHNSTDHLSPQNFDQLEKENNIHLSSAKPPLPSQASKSLSDESKKSVFSWNRDSYNSNSEDEMDSTINENDLIGTALKNLMMESGLGGPEEAAESKRLSCTPRPSLSSSLSGIHRKSIPLSGVKRVGLSKNYKGNKNLTRQLTANKLLATASCGEFNFPPSPDSDVSASSYDKGFAGRLKPGSTGTADSDISESACRKLEVSRVKQHYSSADLYKPRPPLRFTSKRKQNVPGQNGLF